jgi:hypothetical protein
MSGIHDTSGNPTGETPSGVMNHSNIGMQNAVNLNGYIQNEEEINIIQDDDQDEND